MLYNLLLYLQRLFAILSAAADSLPFLIALGLIIGRRGHGAFCILGSRRVIMLAMGLALCGLFYFPASYLAVVLPYGLNKSILDSLLLPQGRPWLAGLLCWLGGLFVLYLAAISLGRLRLSERRDQYPFSFILRPFLLLCLASLAFVMALFLQHWPFAGLPEGMSMERAVMAITRDSLRRFFQSFSPAGALALLYAAWFFSQSSCKTLTVEKAGSLRWFAFWAAAGAIPSLFVAWGLQLASWGRASIPGMANPRLVLIGLLLQSLAVALWIWIVCSPRKAVWRIVLAFILTFLSSFWPLLIRPS